MNKQTIYILVGTLIVGGLIYYFFSGSGKKSKKKYPIKGVFETSYEGQTVRTSTSKGLEPGKIACFYSGGEQLGKGEILDVQEKPDEDFSSARIRIDKETADNASYFTVKENQS
jgi:DUF917 family protein